MTITGADGAELFLVNEGEDCIDLSALPRIVIRGTATYTIVAGRDRFEGASGSGSVRVTAEVERLGAGRASGIFDPLVVSGTLAR